MISFDKNPEEFLDEQKERYKDLLARHEEKMSSLHENPDLERVQVLLDDARDDLGYE